MPKVSVFTRAAFLVTAVTIALAGVMPILAMASRVAVI
jgi:hypothetical protein